ncbi:MAG TPA: hypothetical protein V6C85_31720 [Allocoleopsis sp.]
MSSKLVKQARRLLLSTLIMSAGLWTLPVNAQVSDAQVGALVEALRQAAPQTGTVDDGLYSEWQIKPENIPRWSKQCIGRELTTTQFESSPVTARAILVCVMRDVLREQYSASGNNEFVAVQRAASWWMTGDPNQYNNAPTNSYVQTVLSFYQQQRSNPQAQQSTTPAKPPAATQPQPTSVPSSQTTASSSSSTQISDAQVGALVEALRKAAPQTGTADDGLYSEWQVKADNIPRWSQQCAGKELTPAQFEFSPVTARAILVCVMRDVLREQYSESGNKESVAVKRAASWWMTGDANQYNSDAIASYTQKVLDFYLQSRLKFFSHI